MVIIKKNTSNHAVDNVEKRGILGVADLEKSEQQTGRERSGSSILGMCPLSPSVSQTCKEITFANAQSESNHSFIIRAAV